MRHEPYNLAALIAYCYAHEARRPWLRLVRLHAQARVRAAYAANDAVVAAAVWQGLAEVEKAREG